MVERIDYSDDEPLKNLLVKHSELISVDLPGITGCSTAALLRMLGPPSISGCGTEVSVQIWDISDFSSVAQVHSDIGHIDCFWERNRG